MTTTPAADAPPPPDPASRSGRRLTFARRALYRLGVPVAVFLIRFWWFTCRIVKVIGAEHVTEGLATGPIMPVYWHQHQLFCVRYLLRQQDRGLRLGFLISASVDGELPAMIARRAGAPVIRGSSNTAGARALRDFIVALQQGISPANTPDGPKGPRYGFKPGPILVAQVTGRPLVPVAYHASRAWQFRAWDRFVLPWPFARIVVAVGAPRFIPKGLDAAALQRWQATLEEDLYSLYCRARDAIDGG